jgi:hypothetical protein
VDAVTLWCADHAAELQEQDVAPISHHELRMCRLLLHAQPIFCLRFELHPSFIFTLLRQVSMQPAVCRCQQQQA